MVEGVVVTALDKSAMRSTCTYLFTSKSGTTMHMGINRHGKNGITAQKVVMAATPTLTKPIDSS
jgi:hypothetical protein